MRAAAITSPPCSEYSFDRRSGAARCRQRHGQQALDGIGCRERGGDNAQSSSALVELHIEQEPLLEAEAQKRSTSSIRPGVRLV